MNKILEEIKKIISENITKYLPEVKLNELEENGAVYYMNGKNGTEFDWFVNEHLPNFMVFYNDEKNLGAVKLSIYDDGGILLYIYGEKGNKMVKEVQTSIDVTKDEMLHLAVILKNTADDNKIWDANIDKINTEFEITDDKIKEFEDSKKYMEPTINRNKILSKTAFVSKKIFEDGWKVGYMYRDEARDESDSGWCFLAGNEDSEYTDNYKNIVLLTVYEVYGLDPDIWNYIDSPVGSRFIRISSNEFEIDKNDKEIYVEKRKD